MMIQKSRRSRSGTSSNITQATNGQHLSLRIAGHRTLVDLHSKEC